MSFSDAFKAFEEANAEALAEAFERAQEAQIAAQAKRAAEDKTLRDKYVVIRGASHVSAEGHRLVRAHDFDVVKRYLGNDSFERATADLARLERGETIR